MVKFIIHAVGINVILVVNRAGLEDSPNSHASSFLISGSNANCTRELMGEEAQLNPSKICPECGQSLASAAILCIDCGYHFQLQRRLQTAIDLPTVAPERETIESDPNPYAPPRGVHTYHVQSNLELTESDANWARVIVSDAEYMPWLLVASLCCCAIPMPLMFPYYAYRLSNWTKLDSRFPELHSPNSFSPYGQLAAEFQDARIRLILGVGFGAFFYVVAFVFVIVSLKGL